MQAQKLIKIKQTEEFLQTQFLTNNNFDTIIAKKLLVSYTLIICYLLE